MVPGALGSSFVGSSYADGRAQDCRDIEQLVKDTFSNPHVPDALIVYVGDRPQ